MAEQIDGGPVPGLAEDVNWRQVDVLAVVGGQWRDVEDLRGCGAEAAAAGVAVGRELLAAQDGTGRSGQLRYYIN